MTMRYELVVAGVLLLCAILPVKVVWDLHTLPRLAVCLNLLWAMFVAFHAWPLFRGWIAGLELAWEGFPVDAVSFWCAFLAGALPGAAIYRWTVRDATVDFPMVFDLATGLACTALGVWLFPCLIVMTVSIIPATAQNVLPEEGTPGRLAVVMRATPLRLYLDVAGRVGGERRDALLATRIPATLRDQVFPPPPPPPSSRRPNRAGARS
jgi:hypothetical protein